MPAGTTPIRSILFFFLLSTVSDSEFRALRRHIKSPPGSPLSLTPPRSPSSRRRSRTLSLGLRPPIIIEKGPRGYGFTLQAIRVYFGDTNYYRVHHLVSVSERPHFFKVLYKLAISFIPGRNSVSVFDVTFNN